MEPRATILMPAHNEETVIGRVLGRLAAETDPGEFQVIVICNGCTDRTAAEAKAAMPSAHVISIEKPGKTNALNIGHRHARAKVRIYLDADLEVAACDLRALIRSIETGHVSATCGRMKVDLTGCSLAVRDFYRAWALNPYFQHGKFGGLFAASADLAERLHPLPEVTADDEFVRRSIAAGDCTYVDSCTFTVHAPRTLRDLLKVRRRSLRGARDLDRQGMMAPTASGAQSGASMLTKLAVRPRLWRAGLVYFSISIWVRLALAFENPARIPRWERDDSSRMAA